MDNNEFLDKHIPVNEQKRRNVYLSEIDMTVNTDLKDGEEIDYATKTQLGANKGSFLGLNRGEEPSKSIFGIAKAPFEKAMELATSGIRGTALGGVMIGNQLKNFYKMGVSEIALYNTLNPRNQKKELSLKFTNDEITEEEYLKGLNEIEANVNSLREQYKTDVGMELLADQQYIEEKFGKALKPVKEDTANKFAFDLGAGATSYIGSIGSFILFKNPSLAIAMLSIPEGMQAYNKAIEAGKKGSEAQKIGAETFTWIAVTEYIGTKFLFSALNRNGVLSKHAQNIFKRAPVLSKTATAFVTEGGQEGLQELGSHFIYNFNDIADYSAMEIVKDSLYSFLIGGALGGLTGGLKGIYDWKKVYKSEVNRLYALRNEDGGYKYTLDQAKKIAKETVGEAFGKDLVQETIGLTRKERENYLAQKAQEESIKTIQKNFEDKMASLNASRNIIYNELSVVDKKVKIQAQKLGIDENSAEMMSQMVQNLSKLYFNAYGITPLEYYGMHQIDIKVEDGKIFVDEKDTGKNVLFDEAVATRGILNNNIRQVVLATKCSENINDLVKLTQKLVKNGTITQDQVNNMFIQFGETARNIPKIQDIMAKIQDDYVAELLGDDSFNVEQIETEAKVEEEQERRRRDKEDEEQWKAIQDYENSPEYARDLKQVRKEIFESAKEYLLIGSNGNGFVMRIPTKKISPDRIGEYKDLTDKIKRTFFSSKSTITYDQLESWVMEKYGLDKFDVFEFLQNLQTELVNADIYRQGPRGAVTMPNARIRWNQQHKKIIELFKTADKTTLMHELSHIYLREMEIIRNNRGMRSQDLDDMFKTLDKWLGEPKNGQYTKAQQEKFAKGFETYLATGKTPNAQLAGVFEKVREWFKVVYLNAKDYLVDISPEIEMMFRGMFNVNLERAALERFMRRPQSRILNTPVETSSRYNQDAWHGTPHDFNRFSTRKIGTGQGARVHGWGLYFAKNRQLSEQYREELTRELYGNQTLYFDEEKIAEEYDKLEELATKQQPSAIRDTMYDRLAFLEDLLILHDEQEVIDRGYHKQKVIEWFDKNIKDKVINKNRKTGQLFKVDIPENEELLDEQKKIKDQPKSIQEKLRKLYKGEKWIEDKLSTLNKDFEEITGEELYSILVDQAGTDNQDSDKEASLLLNKYGIKGITYDGHQDGRGFVVFDKKAINILEKYYQSKKDETQQETAEPSIITADNVETFFQDEPEDSIDPNYGQELEKEKEKSTARPFADVLQPLSSQVGKIIRAGEGMLRLYEARLSIHKQQYLDVAERFLRDNKRLAKTNRKDYYIFSKALFNGDGEMIEKVLKKYPYLREGYNQVRDLLDNKIKDELRDIGVKVDNFADRIYFPRKVDNVRGLIGFLRREKMWSEIERAMEQKDKDWEKWDEDTKADFINKWLKGYTNTKITNTSDNVKQRKINELTDEMLRYYKPPNEALIDYIASQNNMIETAKFLGVKKEVLEGVTDQDGVTNTKKMTEVIEGQLTKVVRKLVENKEISYEQEEKLKELLKARFNFQNSPAWVSFLKSVAFLSTLNNFSTSLTQFGDLAWSFRVSIPYTLKNIPKAFLDKAKLSMKRHLGLDDPTQELTDMRATNLTRVNKVLTTVLKPFFARVDKLGKNTYINTVYDKYKKMIKTEKGEHKLYEQFEELYGKEYADLFINALKQDEVTEDIALLAFAELAKVQPIALSEMPRQYLESPKGRMFYALKTFTIKQLDTIYTQSIRKIRRGMEEQNSEMVGEGVADMAMYMAFFFLIGASKDLLRDILFNREIDVTDTMIDNVLTLFGLTKYSLYNGREYNIENFWNSLITFPLINQFVRFNSDIQKVFKGKMGIKDLSIWRNAIPLFGDFYDEYFGGAKERKEKKKAKKKKKEQKKQKGFVF